MNKPMISSTISRWGRETIYNFLALAFWSPPWDGIEDETGRLSFHRSPVHVVCMLTRALGMPHRLRACPRNIACHTRCSAAMALATLETQCATTCWIMTWSTCSSGASSRSTPRPIRSRRLWAWTIWTSSNVSRGDFADSSPLACWSIDNMTRGEKSYEINFVIVGFWDCQTRIWSQLLLLGHLCAGCRCAWSLVMSCIISFTQIRSYIFIWSSLFSQKLYSASAVDTWIGLGDVHKIGHGWEKKCCASLGRSLQIDLRALCHHINIIMWFSLLVLSLTSESQVEKENVRWEGI
jgi:hypothetical protein